MTDPDRKRPTPRRAPDWYEGDHQRWSASAGEVVNKTSFGARLVAFLQRAAVVGRRPAVGWMDGACQLLAETMDAWASEGPRGVWDGPATVWMVRDGSLRPQHVVFHVGGLYLDGDGVASEHDLLGRLAALERLPAPLEVRPHLPRPEDWSGGPDDRPVTDAALAERLAGRLNAEFGPLRAAVADIATPVPVRPGGRRLPHP